MGKESSFHIMFQYFGSNSSVTYLNLSLKTENVPTTQSLAQVTVSELTRHSQGSIFLLYTQEMAKWVEYAGYVCLMNDFKGESTWLLGGTSIMRSTVLYLVTHVPYPRTKPLPVCHVSTNDTTYEKRQCYNAQIIMSFSPYCMHEISLCQPAINPHT